MVILITGCSHTGKTLLAQKLLEQYYFPYLSIDHLKMGLIRSGQTDLTPEDDDKITAYIWPIVSEMIKTAIENKQNLIVEGCYIPFDFKNYFSQQYLDNIKYICLIFSEQYIDRHYGDIVGYENEIEQRASNDCSKQLFLSENAKTLCACKKHELDFVLIDNDYIANINSVLDRMRDKINEWLVWK